MKSLIKAITIVFVILLFQAGDTVAQNTLETESRKSVIQYDGMTASNSSDALMQLRTVLSAQTQQYGGGKVLVIPTAQIQQQNMVNLMEDMTVMCRIFDRKLAQSGLIPETHVWAALSSRYLLGDRSMEAMYVQGYGALFMITVDFPLSPLPQKEEKEETEEDNDPLWEQMKQEIFSPAEASRYTPDLQEEKYDAKKVENLKTTIKNALIHAANIRSLKPEESVILTVIGGTAASNVGKIAVVGTNQAIVHYKDRNVTKLLKSPSSSDIGYSSPTVLVIRTKKSYIDALAQNKIDYDEFEQKIQLISYPCLGENISWGFWPGETNSSVHLPSSESVDRYEGGDNNRRRDRASRR